MKKLLLALGTAGMFLLTSCASEPTAKDLPVEQLDLTSQGLEYSLNAPKGAVVTKDQDMDDFYAEVKKDDFEVTIEFIDREGEELVLESLVKEQKDNVVNHNKDGKVVSETADSYLYSYTDTFGKTVYNFNKITLSKTGFIFVSTSDSENKETVEFIYKTVTK